MINKKDNDDKKPDDSTSGIVNAHLVIKERDTGRVIVNQRG